jgi:serine/threonine protein kinase
MDRAAMAIPESRIERLAVGVELDSRYRLEALAGTGGMSTVWRARDERLGRTVAIKVMSDSLAADSAAVTRFSREARTHANISHPNLVRVFDYSVTASRPYLVMEYIAGATLSQRLDQRDLSGPELTPLARDLLSAIACVHDHGVLHRDIKPANVLIDSGGHGRLTDFGIAHLNDATRITSPGDVVGTLRFLSPEIMAGGTPSCQSDLFALGVTLRSAAEGLTIDEELRELTDWLTQPRPGDRPPDAHSALWVLQAPRPPLTATRLRDATARQEPTPVEQATLPLRVQRRFTARSRRRAVALAALAGVTLSIGATVAESGGGGGGRGFGVGTPTTPHRAKTGVASDQTGTTSAPTINSDLNALATAVKQAKR